MFEKERVSENRLEYIYAIGNMLELYVDLKDCNTEAIIFYTNMSESNYLYDVENKNITKEFLQVVTIKGRPEETRFNNFKGIDMDRFEIWTTGKFTGYPYILKAYKEDVDDIMMDILEEILLT